MSSLDCFTNKEEIFKFIFSISELKGCSISMIHQVCNQLLKNLKGKEIQKVINELSIIVNAYMRVIAIEQFNEIINPFIETICKSDAETYEIYPEKLKNLKIKKTRENFSKLVSLLLGKLFESYKLFPASLSVCLNTVISKLMEQYPSVHSKEEFVPIFLIDNFFCKLIENHPSLEDPKKKELYKAPVSYLAQIIRILSSTESTENSYYTPFNNMIKKNHNEMKKFFVFVSNVSRKKSDLKILEAVVDWSSNSDIDDKLLKTHLKYLHIVVSLKMHTIKKLMESRKSKITNFMTKTLEEMGVPDTCDESNKKKEKKQTINESKKKKKNISPKKNVNIVQQEQRIFSVKQGFILLFFFYLVFYLLFL